MSSKQHKAFKQRELEYQQDLKEENQEKISRTTDPLKKLENCKNIADSLSEKATEIITAPAVIPDTKQAVKTSHAANIQLREHTDRHNQLAKDITNAIADRNLKQDIFTNAGHELRIAQSSYDKLGSRASNTDTEQLNAIHKQVSDLHNDVNLANKTVSALQSEYSFSQHKLENARRTFARLQSAEIIREALINAGLLDAIQESITLFMSQNSGSSIGVKENLIEAFFNAVLTDNKLPSFETSLKALDGYR